MSTTTARDLKITKIMEELLSKARLGDYSISEELKQQLNRVCSTSIWGFREILLVVCIGRLLNASFSPTTALYGCNPRALYEGAIRRSLTEANIPHRKSGPLNIAKATAGLNDSWAAQRRPQAIAKLVVELARHVEQSDEAAVRDFTVTLLSCLLEEAQRVAGYEVEVPKEASIESLNNICSEMIKQVPDAGNTPQRIVGLLLQLYHNFLGSGVAVEGYLDRASVTSTTSKKPGDIMEVSTEGQLLTVYEVTVKPFDENRLSDSFDTAMEYVSSTGQEIKEIVVICRKDDIPSSAELIAGANPYMATFNYNGMTYQFIDIYSWIVSALIRLGVDARTKFYSELNMYIAEPDTAENVKIYWKQLHQQLKWE